MVLNLKAHPPTGIAYLPSRATGGANQITKWLDPGGCIDDARQNDEGISLCQVCAKRAQNAKYQATAADSSSLRSIAKTESKTGNTQKTTHGVSRFGSKMPQVRILSPRCDQKPVPSWCLNRPARGRFFYCSGLPWVVRGLSGGEKRSPNPRSGGPKRTQKTFCGQPWVPCLASNHCNSQGP